MINLYRNYSKEKGATTLIVTIVLFLLITLIMLFSAQYNVQQQKTSANTYRYNQAYEAAEAGMEFGINYLKENRATILATASGGHINYSDSNTTNINLANNSRFSVVFTNPTANNYDLILITSTGLADDSTGTRVITQLVQFGSLLNEKPDFPVISKGNVEVAGNGTITNLEQEQSIQAAEGITFSGLGKTVTASGIHQGGADSQGEVASLQNMTVEDLLASFLGSSSSTVKNNFPYYYSQSSSYNYSSTLNGKMGTAIWIDQLSGEANISGTTVIGTPTDPVLLVINGNLDISGNVTIYGFVFVTGSASAEADITGNVAIHGGLLSAGSLRIAGNASSTFSSTVLNNLQNETSLTYYARVMGSWKDF